jgi:hypothetical protein
MAKHVRKALEHLAKAVRTELMWIVHKVEKTALVVLGTHIIAFQHLLVMVGL